MIESCSVNDPNAFWEHIQKLGPKTKERIPWEVAVDGKVETDESIVLSKWKYDFESIYHTQHTQLDEALELPSHKNLDHDRGDNDLLNQPLKRIEVE